MSVCGEKVNNDDLWRIHLPPPSTLSKTPVFPFPDLPGGKPCSVATRCLFPVESTSCTLWMSLPTSDEMLVTPSAPKTLLVQTLAQFTPPSVDFQMPPTP